MDRFHPRGLLSHHRLPPPGKQTNSPTHHLANLLETISFRGTRGDWKWQLLLAMPDHPHGMVASPRRFHLERQIAAWKRWLAHTRGDPLARRFFGHRLRSEESAREKALYIRKNPVRAGLVDTAFAWPYLHSS